MKIGEAAKASGVSAKMIRYYERIGLLPSAHRLQSGYRDYDGAAVARLRLIRQARDAGFSLQRAGQLVRVWEHRDRPDTRVVVALVAELKLRAAATAEIVKNLRRLTRAGLAKPLPLRSRRREMKGSRGK